MSSKKAQKADLLLQLISEWLSHNCVDLHAVISVETAGVYIPVWKKLDIPRSCLQISMQNREKRKCR
jgi:stringent starvation protein B